MGCLAAGALLSVALIVSAVIVSGAFRDLGYLFGKQADAANPVNAVKTAVAPATPTIIARPPAIRQVRAVADLTTVSAMMSTVVEAEMPRASNLIKEKLLLIACGKVTAGVDLSKIRDQDVTSDADGTVTIRLPQAEVQDAFLIDDSTQPCTTKVYDRTNLIVIPETQELEGQAREKAVKAIRDTAIQSGLLNDANRNARAVLERVLQLAGYTKVVFVP